MGLVFANGMLVASNVLYGFTQLLFYHCGGSIPRVAAGPRVRRDPWGKLEPPLQPEAESLSQALLRSAKPQATCRPMSVTTNTYY